MSIELSASGNSFAVNAETRRREAEAKQRLIRERRPHGADGAANHTARILAAPGCIKFLKLENMGAHNAVS